MIGLIVKLIWCPDRRFAGPFPGKCGFQLKWIFGGEILCASIMRCLLTLKEGGHFFTHNGFHVFYNSNPIAIFLCVPFSDIQALKDEFSNLYFPVFVNDLDHYFLF